MRKPVSKKPYLRPEKKAENRAVYGETDSKDIISVGLIVQAYGIRGQVKVIPYTDSPERFERLDSVFLEFPDGTVSQYDIKRVLFRGEIVLVAFHGIADRTAAEALRGAWISVRREEMLALAENSYYMFDLLGMEVYDGAGLCIGAITRIEDYPANAVLVVESETKEIWIPALRETVISVDLETRRLVVCLPKGLPYYPKSER